RGMHGARQRLDQDRALVRQLVRYGVQLRDVRDQLTAPPAAGVGAETRLQTGRDVADRDPITAVAVALRARGAEVEPARRTGEHPGQPAADRARRDVTRQRAVDLERVYHRLLLCSARASRPASSGPTGGRACQVSIGHFARRATRDSAMSGSTATGWPTARSN